MQYQGRFHDATLVHYASKHQLWLHIPDASEVFVYDIRMDSWSTIVYGSGFYGIQTLGLSMAGGRNVPVVAATSFDGFGSIARGERSDATPWADDGYDYERLWMSHALPRLGRHQRRRFRRIRPQLRDTNDTETLRFFWCVDGQDYGDAIAAGQYNDVTLASARSMMRGRDELTDDDAGEGGVDACHYGRGDLEFDQRLSVSGERRGYNIQIGVRALTSCGEFELRSFELDTRVEPGRRR